jgi:competence protein ComEA
MTRSLLIKLSMLAVTAALIVWIGWPAPPALQEEAGDPPAPAGSVEARTGTAVAPDAEPGVARESRVDLNRAGVAELEQLPGIGRVLAQRVVDWRGAHGRFKSVDELSNVKGIGSKKLAQIKPLVRVGDRVKL